MKKLIIYLFVLLPFILVISACPKATGTEPTLLGGDINDQNQFPVNLKVERFTYSIGNRDSDIVILWAQGGPLYQNQYEGIGRFEAINSNVHWVYVDQFQVLYPQPFLLRDLDISEIELAIRQTVELYYNAAKYYKEKGKKVVIAGGSYGAFIIQQIIAEKGLEELNKYIDKYLILVGRLNMPQEMGELFLKGNPAKFAEDGLTILPSTTNAASDEIWERNINRLIGSVGIIDYTYLLDDKIPDGTSNKIFYSYGTNDANVGTMLENEIRFMERKGFVVFRDEKTQNNPGDHFSAAQNGFVFAFQSGFLPAHSPLNLLAKNGEDIVSENDNPSSITALSAVYQSGSTVEFFNGESSLGTVTVTAANTILGNAGLAELTLNPALNASNTTYKFKARATTKDGHQSAFSDLLTITTSQ